MRWYDANAENFGTMGDALLAYGISRSLYYNWRKRSDHFRHRSDQWMRDIKARRKIQKRVLSAKVVPRQLREHKPKNLTVAEKKFLELFAHHGDRIQAADEADVEWEEIEEQLAEGGVLAEEFEKIEKRHAIRLRDSLRSKVIKEGNSSALSALIRLGAIDESGESPGSTGAVSQDDLDFYSERIQSLGLGKRLKVIH